MNILVYPLIAAICGLFWVSEKTTSFRLKRGAVGVDKAREQMQRRLGLQSEMSEVSAHLSGRAGEGMVKRAMRGNEAVIDLLRNVAYPRSA